MKHEEMQLFMPYCQLNCIIKDQFRHMKQQDYPAVNANLKCLPAQKWRARNHFGIYQKDPSSPPHQNICAIVVDESAAFLILRPKSLHTPSDKVSL